MPTPKATSLLYTMGHHANPKTADMAGTGIACMKQFMSNELKSKEKGIVVHDGCGLCVHNQLTPYFLCEILRYGYEHKQYYDFLQRFLAISGQDGTLRRWPTEMKGKRARQDRNALPPLRNKLAGRVCQSCQRSYTLFRSDGLEHVGARRACTAKGPVRDSYRRRIKRDVRGKRLRRN